MSDREYGGSSDDLSLPKATVSKIITEILAQDPGLTFARDARDMLIECCVEFVTLISSEANEIAEKEAKKTIACEHVTSALNQLGYPDYIPEINRVAAEHKQFQATKEKKGNKLERSGKTVEELLAEQEALLGAARTKYHEHTE